MNFLYTFCENKIRLPQSDMRYLAQVNGVPIDKAAYQVYVLSASIENKTMAQYRMYQDLERICVRYSTKKNNCVSCDGDNVSVVLLLYAINDVENYDDLSNAQDISDYLEKHGLSGVTIIGGSIVYELADIHYSFKRAINTLMYVGTDEINRIYFSRDFEHLFELPVLQSTVAPQDILHLFRTGTLGELRDAVSIEVERVRRVSGYFHEKHHPTSIRRTFIEWTVYLLHLSADMGVNVDEVLGNIDPYRYLLGFSGGTPELIDWFIDFCARLRMAIRQQQTTKEDQLLKRVLNMVEENMMDYDLSLTGVSGELNVSASYLSRLFMRKMKVGFSQYVNQKRLEKACELLADKKLSIEDIAIRSGFSGATYLGRKFKQAYGCTPNQYRKQMWTF